MKHEHKAATDFHKQEINNDTPLNRMASPEDNYIRKSREVLQKICSVKNKQK